MLRPNPIFYRGRSSIRQTSSKRSHEAVYRGGRAFKVRRTCVKDRPGERIASETRLTIPSAVMLTLPRRRANAIWNPNESLHPPPISTAEFGERQGEMERYIRDKYEGGLFRADRVERKESTKAPSRERQTTRSDSTMGEARDRREEDYGYNADATASGSGYAYNGHGGGSSSNGGSTGKKKATRAHVDSNWADFMSADVVRPTSGDAKKAGRLLGMERDDDDRDWERNGPGGGIRLPPVTKAPAGLVYKQDGETAPRKASPPPPPRQVEKPQEKQQDPAAAPLVDLQATAPMQRAFAQPPPLPSPAPSAYNTNPFLQGPPPPIQSPMIHLNPSIHTGGYLSAQTTPLYPPTSIGAAFPFVPQVAQGGGYYSSPGIQPGVGSGGYFGQGEGMPGPFGQQQQQFGQQIGQQPFVQRMPQPFGQQPFGQQQSGQTFGQGMQQGQGFDQGADQGQMYGGWSR